MAVSFYPNFARLQSESSACRIGEVPDSQEIPSAAQNSLLGSADEKLAAPQAVDGCRPAVHVGVAVARLQSNLPPVEDHLENVMHQTESADVEEKASSLPNEPVSVGSFYTKLAQTKAGSQPRYGFAPQVARSAAALTGDAAGPGADASAEATFTHRHKSTWHAALNKKIISQRSAESVLYLADELLSGFDLQNTVTAISCISQSDDALKFRRDARFLELLYKLEGLWDPGGFTVEKDECMILAPHHLGSIAAALARMQPSRRDGAMQRILRTLAASAASMVPIATPMDLTLLAWAFATLVQKPRTLMLAVACEATQKICDFNEQHISNTTWAFAKLDVRYDPWITAMVEETLTRLEHLSPQHVSNIVWSLGSAMIKSELRIGFDSWRLISTLATLAAENIHDYDPQALSNISWSLARLGASHEVFMGRLAAVGPEKIGSFPTLDITNMAYSFAKMGLSSPELLHAFRKHSLEKMADFSSGEIGRLVWSLSVLGGLEVTWLDAAVARFVECCRERSPEQEQEGWALLHVANCSAPYRKHLRHWPELERYFRITVFSPTLTSLQSMKNAKEESEVEAAIEDAQKFITRLDIDYLGANYTRSLLWHLLLVDPSDARAGDAFQASWALPGSAHEQSPPPPSWVVNGRAVAKDAAREMRDNLSDASRMFDRFGPHERRVVSWFGYDLNVQMDTQNLRGQPVMNIRENGRVARFIDDEQRAMHVRGERTFEHLVAGGAGERLANATASGLLALEDVKRVHQWLPGLFAQHERLGHCERQALVEVFLSIIAMVRSVDANSTDGGALLSGMFDGLGGITVHGEIRLYVAHYCCISCLSVLCHFSRRVPNVRVFVDYDDCWQTRILDT